MPRLSRLLWWAGVTALAAGAVLCVLGWYGASGERFAERQLPYLASSTVPGAALLVAGAVWTTAALVTGVWEGWLRGTEGLGPETGTEAGFRPSSPEPPVRLPGGTLAHRPDCPLVAGKPGLVPAGGAGLEPCPVCEPEARDGVGGRGPGGDGDGNGA
ncbi:hypothetical protein I3F58_08210 [Streptomyces sp. MUM 203J]|uniref:hypothetical protein n=1 Tax=Streptomyces sp. MUM 203J TaxID=2791990 RepID=UPI001F04E94B|nr:hypothetical protein [Streptomyces sp. MUM 203J]MCH0539549.1 hypothetical protein [Streptomyces sp. MUM 203J]